MIPPELTHGILLYLILMASVCLHEWAHAWIADRLGDPTPRHDGRTSLNPAVHFDPIGTLIMPVVFIFLFQSVAPFGWGKRIILNPDHFRRPSRDEILVWLSGPACNLVIAVLAAILGGLLVQAVPRFHDLMEIVIRINALLIVINLLPVPPLDGGYILKQVTGMSEATFHRLSAFAFFILLALFLFPPTMTLISIAFDFFYKSFIRIMVVFAGFAG